MSVAKASRYNAAFFGGRKDAPSAAELDRAYKDFKRDYFLGPGWIYRTTKHLWWGGQVH